MNKTFSELGIAPPILQAIDDMGFDAPTEVQARGIPHILNKEDLIVISKTGSGKTAVFGVPMLQMTEPSDEGPQGLILAPTRELAVQVETDIKQMAKYLPHRLTAVYGQHNINTEIKTISDGVEIIAGTPGRVFDHIRHGKLNTKKIRFLVLDEADRMLDMGFLDQVVKIVRTLPKDRVTLLFSATMPPEVLRICREYMKHPITIAIESPTKTVDTISQAYYRVERNRKNTELERLLTVEQPDSCIIFCNTKSAVDRVYSFLARRGHSCQPLHGDIPQAKRMKTIDGFKAGEFHILIATDVAARGIHIDELSLVINYDVPGEKDSYVHRIGRTGRIGNTGKALTMVTGEDIISLYEIEEHIGAMIGEADLPTDAEVQGKRASADIWKKSKPMVEPAPEERERERRQPRERGTRERQPGERGRRERQPAEGGRRQAEIRTEKPKEKPNEDRTRERVPANVSEEENKPKKKRRRRRKPSGKAAGESIAAAASTAAAAPAKAPAGAPPKKHPEPSTASGSPILRLIKGIFGKK